jgi:small subunit ribosomal protein S11
MKRKWVKQLPELGVINIHGTSNNTIINITNSAGESCRWSSCGLAGFRGAKKKTAFAAQSIARELACNLYSQGLRNAAIRLKGFGRARDIVMQEFDFAGIKIESISEATRFPHNGCRPPKKRRL